MKSYKVTITEFLRQTVEVEAENPADAEERVREEWLDSKYILGAEQFDHVEFDAVEITPTKGDAGHDTDDM